MSSFPMAAVADQPTPEPGSTVVTNGSARLNRPHEEAFVAYFAETTPAEDAYFAARSAAVEEGRRLYGDETSDAWLTALENGTHPLCRVAEPPRR